MKASFSFREITPCLYAVLVDILGFGLALPVLTALFTGSNDVMFSSSVSETLRFGYLALGFVLYPLFMFFGSSFMGDLSDIIGRKKVLLMCMAGFTLGFFCMGFAVTLKSLFLLFFGRSLTGLMAASLPTTMAAIADLSTKENKARHMSLVVLVQSIGFVLGPLLSGLLSAVSLGVPFYFGAFLAFVAVLWIFLAFQESFVKKTHKQIRFLRIFLVFSEVFKHRLLRILTLAFIFHQMGIALYVQLILIYLRQSFAYSAFMMGMFNAFFGLWMAIGILVIVPFATKRLPVERIAYVCLALTGASQLLSSIFSFQVALWLFVIPLGMFANVAWTAMLTSVSNAVDDKSQGWALGITGAVVALSFILTGFSPNLVPIIGSLPLIALGGVCFLIAWAIMRFYCHRFAKSP